MKRLFLATAALIALAGSASAGPDVVCAAPRVFVGDTFDRNPVVRVEVTYFPDDHAWRVFHILQNGQIVSRGEQYAITDWSDKNKVQWTGSLNRNRNLHMIGEMKKNLKDGHPVYIEWLYDRAKGDQLVMNMEADCQWNVAIEQPTPPSEPSKSESSKPVATVPYGKV
jgi:hypothetical protein